MSFNEKRDKYSNQVCNGSNNNSELARIVIAVRNQATCLDQCIESTYGECLSVSSQ